MNQRSELAISTVIGSVLIVGITVTLGAGIYFLLPDADPQDVIRSEIRLDDRDGQYLEPVGGDVLSANDTVVRIQTENGFEERTLFELGVGDKWNVGERVCIVGDGAGCIYPTGTATERITIVGGGQVISSVNTAQLGGDGVAPVQKPDLNVAYQGRTPEPSVGQSTDFSFTVHNVGPIDAGAFIVNFDHDGVTSTQNVASLASGASTTLIVSQTVTAGTHTWTVTADLADTIDESNELNNVVQHAYSASAPLGDITVAFEDVSQAPVEGEDSVFRFRVSAADEDIGQFDVQIQLGGVEVHTETIASLNAGDHTFVSHTWNDVRGDYTYTVTVDTGDEVTESNEGNNVVTHDFTATKPLADLIITAVSIQPDPQVGQESAFSFRLQNAGQVDSGPFTFRWIYDDFERNYGANSIAAGYDETIPITFESTEGDHVFSIILDILDEVEELDETNNQATFTFTTAPAPVQEVQEIDVGQANLRAIGAGDVDGDGDNDIIVADSGTYLHYVENKEGTFEWEDEQKMNAFVSQIDVLEVTGKHSGPEIMVSYESGTVKMYNVNENSDNIGKAKRDLKSPFSNTHVFQFEVADLNGDSRLDVVVAHDSPYSDPGGVYYKLQDDKADFSSNKNQWEQLGAFEAKFLAVFEAKGDPNRIDVFSGDEDVNPGGDFLYEQKSWGWQQNSNVFTGATCGAREDNWDHGSISPGAKDSILIPCPGAGSGPCLILASPSGNKWNGQSLIDCEWNTNSDCGRARQMGPAKFADLDNDGDLDIVSADLAGVAYHFENDGNGNFQKSCHYFGSNLVFTDLVVFQADADAEMEIALVANDKNIYLMDGIF